MVLSALYQHVQDVVAAKSDDSVGGAKRQYSIHSAPPDGLCCYHSVLGSLQFGSWSKVARHEGGFAVNTRHVRQEAADAASLRQLALESTDTSDPTMVELAQRASQGLSLDVCELSWLGHTLDLAIRCTIDDKARCWNIF